MPNRAATRLVSLLLCAAFAVTAGDAMAQRGGGKDRGAPRTEDRGAEQRSHERSAEQRALSAAVRRVESQTGGQVLSAERIPFDGRDVSRIKVVDASGRVRVYMDDPRSSDNARPPRDRDDAPKRQSRTRDDDN